MLAEDVSEGPLAHALSKAVADAPEIERNALAQMAEDHLESGIRVKHSRQHKADALCRGLHVEAPAGAQQSGMLLRIILVIGFDDGRLRDRRMDVDRHV